MIASNESCTLSIAPPSRGEVGVVEIWSYERSVVIPVPAQNSVETAQRYRQSLLKAPSRPLPRRPKQSTPRPVLSNCSRVPTARARSSI